MELPDAMIIDGDHNYYTVSEELAGSVSAARAARYMPLLLLHDVGWPHARRDAYLRARPRPRGVPGGDRGGGRAGSRPPRESPSAAFPTSGRPGGGWRENGV